MYVAFLEPQRHKEKSILSVLVPSWLDRRRGGGQSAAFGSFCTCFIMKIIAFINEAVVIREILNHLGEPTSPPMLKPARGPPLWERDRTSVV